MPVNSTQFDENIKSDIFEDTERLVIHSYNSYQDFAKSMHLVDFSEITVNEDPQPIREQYSALYMGRQPKFYTVSARMAKKDTPASKMLKRDLATEIRHNVTSFLGLAQADERFLDVSEMFHLVLPSLYKISFIEGGLDRTEKEIPSALLMELNLSPRLDDDFYTEVATCISDFRKQDLDLQTFSNSMTAQIKENAAEIEWDTCFYNKLNEIVSSYPFLFDPKTIAKIQKRSSILITCSSLARQYGLTNTFLVRYLQSALTTKSSPDSYEPPAREVSSNLG